MQSAHYRPAVIESRRLVCHLCVALVLFAARAAVACDPCLYNPCAEGCPLAASPRPTVRPPATINVGGSSTLSATPSNEGDDVKWYTDGCGGTYVGSGTSLVVSPLVSTTYYARELNWWANCESATCCEVTVT